MLARIVQSLYLISTITLLVLPTPFTLAGDPVATKVFVSILPQKSVVEEIGGPNVDVNVLVAPGQSPETYDPTAKQIADLMRSDAYFTIGLPFESRIRSRVSTISDQINIVDTRRGIEFRNMESGHAHLHDYRGAKDPHIWLAPKLVKLQAQTICDALSELDTADSSMYRANLRTFTAKLDSIDNVIMEMLEPFAGRSVFVYHPSFGYFLDSYGLKQVPLEIEGKAPNAKDVAELVEQVRIKGATTIFVQKQFSPDAAEAVAESAGASVVYLDPLAENCLENFVEIAAAIRDSFGESE
jgi:zinc transport system substrate-binding protein